MLENLKNQFLLDPDITFLNHGSFGACPKTVCDNLQDWQNRVEKEPVQFFETDIFPLLADSRKALGKFLGCEGDDLVYYPNPTHAVNAVARSLKLKAGDEVLGTNHIYGALDFTWQQVCKDTGAEFIKADLPLPINSKDEFLNIFFSYVSNKTRVIFISHITSMTAMIFPVNEIIQFARQRDIITIIDGAHVPGHLPLRLTELDPDIYTGACHKWMCSPKGTSFLYVKKEMQENIHPLIVSWGWESENPSNTKFLDWHEWQGTRDMSAFLTIPEAVKFMDDNDWPNVSRKCREMVIQTRNQLLNYLNISPPCPDDWLGQMASIPLPFNDAVEIKNLLLNKYHIQVPVFTWEGKVYLRYSIQAYNSESDLEKLLSAIKELLG